MRPVSNGANGGDGGQAGALTPAQRDRVVAALAGVEPGKGNLLPALHRVQHELGWVPRAAMALVARRLGISEAQVYGPATFYSEFRLTPPPATLLTWCSGPTCRVLGGERIKLILEETLDCRLGENGPGDGYGLWLGQCNGTCEQAPQVWLNGRVVGKLSLAGAARLARRLRDGETADAIAPPPPDAVEIQPALVRRAETPEAAS
ncbi:MAG: hypothetical protein F4Y94_00985 [Chloroflexi bacterium]|nr:hypothetical protein [Chloroflexota bacterium]